MEIAVQCEEMWGTSGRGKENEEGMETGKDNIGEVDEYKYLGVWINRQVNGRNHIRHLLGKADRLHALVRVAKFWQEKKT